jgi:hypothetical protein
MTAWTSVQILQSLPIRYMVVHPDMNGYAVSHIEATPSVFTLMHTANDGAKVYAINRGGLVNRTLRRRFRDDQLSPHLQLGFRVPSSSGVSAVVQLRLNDGPVQVVALGPGAHDITPPLAPRVRGVNTLSIEVPEGLGTTVELVAIRGDDTASLTPVIRRGSH